MLLVAFDCCSLPSPPDVTEPKDNENPELRSDVCFESPKVKAGFVSPPWFAPPEPNVKPSPEDEAPDPNTNIGLVSSFWP